VLPPGTLVCGYEEDEMGLVVLRRVDITVYKDKMPGSDNCGSSQKSVKTGVHLGNNQSCAENSGFPEAPCSAERA